MSCKNYFARYVNFQFLIVSMVTYLSRFFIINYQQEEGKTNLTHLVKNKCTLKLNIDNSYSYFIYLIS